MSDMSINLSMGGSFYRASQNTAKVNRAVNQMLNRLETGQKYQYAYQNISAVTEGSSLKASIATQEAAVSANSKKQMELDPVMQAQTEIMSILGQMKEVGSEYLADSTGSSADALKTQYEELAKAANEIAASAKFAGGDLAAGLSGVDIDAGRGVTHSLTTNAININTTISDLSDIDTAITNLSKDSASLGVLYNNVLESNKTIMTSDMNAMTQRFSSLLTADDNETSALLMTLNNRLDAINASKQYAAGYMGNSIALTNILA